MAAFLAHGETARARPEAVRAAAKWAARPPHPEDRVHKLVERLRGALRVPLPFAFCLAGGGAAAGRRLLEITVRAFGAETGRLAHVVVAGEVPGVVEEARTLETEKLAQLSVVAAMDRGTKAGTLNPQAVCRAVRQNTCLVIVPAVSPTAGAINALNAIATSVRGRRVPLAVDVTHLLGLTHFDPEVCNAAAYFGSFHAAGGLPGSGFLAVSELLAEGYRLGPYLGWRAADVDTTGAAAALGALRAAAREGQPRRVRLRDLRDRAWRDLCARYPSAAWGELDATWDEAARGDEPAAAVERLREQLCRGADAAALVRLGPSDPSHQSPATLLFAVLYPGFSALRAASLLREEGIEVEAAPEAVPAPPFFRGFTIRLGLSLATGSEEVDAFLGSFPRALRKACL